MKNIEVIRTFLEQRGKAKTTHLITEGNKLINYTTEIARINGKNELEINCNYYSQTTSTIQNTLIRLSKQFDYIVVLNGTSDRVEQANKLLKA